MSDRSNTDFYNAVAHAEEILAALAPSSETEDTAFRVHLLGLECMTQYAHDELDRFERFARTLAQDLSACASPTPSANILLTDCPTACSYSVPAFGPPPSCLPAQLKNCGGGADTCLQERR
jgi:hypothetical protein